MNRIIACLLTIGVLASSTLLVDACTPDTCTGPVTKYFSTSDCSDTPSINQMSQVNAGTCEPFAPTSQSWSCDTEGGLIVSVFSDTTCSRRSAVLTYGVGVCIQTGTNNALVYSCSVNDTFTPAKTSDQSLPTRTASTVECASPGNCSAVNPAFYYTWYTTHDANDFTCASANASFSNAWQQSANFSLGECFVNEAYSNIKFTCTADELITAHYQNPAGCVGTPYYVFSASRACNSPVQGKKRDEQEEAVYPRMTFTCDAPATPQAPTSSSPSQSSSLTMVAFFLAILGSILACL